MTNPTHVIRSLVIYAICIPVALVLGYLITTPLEWRSFGTVGVVLTILILPLVLRYHYPAMLLGWNMSMIVFFMPGAPNVWLPLVALSLGICIVRRAIDQEYRFLSVSSLTWPFLVFAAVVLITAEANGGIRLRSLGGDVYGGKKYVFILAGIAAYFAVTAEKIPVKRSKLYVTLFLVGAITTLMGDVFYVDTRALQWLWYFFPPTMTVDRETGGIGRFAGLGAAAGALFYALLARYGVRGVLDLAKPHRVFFFLVLGVAGLLGGFRSALLSFAIVFSIMFYLEGLHRTKLLAVMLVAMLLAGSIILPFARQLPYNLQRALAILPIDIDPRARMDADDSAQWRLDMWKALLPQVPEYMLLGKGYAMTQQDFSYALSNQRGNMRAMSADESWAALAADYHSGPLSVTIPFGIWGDLTVLWLFAAGFRVMYKNYKYGSPELQTLNRFLFATYIMRVAMFIVIVGAIYNDIQAFAGYLGLSVALNGGVAKKPTPKPERAAEKPDLPRLLPETRSAVPSFAPDFPSRNL